MGKLHNIGIWILPTSQRCDHFSQRVRLARDREYTGLLIPSIGNITRWSSDVDALERAFELQDILDGFVRSAMTEERHAKTRRLSHVPPSAIEPQGND